MTGEWVICGAAGVAALALQDALHDLAGPFGDLATIAAGSAIVLMLARRTVRAWRGIDRLVEAIVGDRDKGTKGVVVELAEHREETRQALEEGRRRMDRMEARIAVLAEGDRQAERRAERGA